MSNAKKTVLGGTAVNDLLADMTGVSAPAVGDDAQEAAPATKEKSRRGRKPKGEVSAPQKITLNGIVIQPRENKSDHVNFLLYPSIRKRAQRLCKDAGVSLNTVVNELLRSWIDEQEANAK